MDSIGSVSISEMESFPYEVTQSNDSEGLKHCRFLEPRTIGQQVIFKERLGECMSVRGGCSLCMRDDLYHSRVFILATPYHFQCPPCDDHLPLSLYS